MFCAKKFNFLVLRTFYCFLCLLLFNCLCKGENYNLDDHEQGNDCGYYLYKNSSTGWNHYNGSNRNNKNVMHFTGYNVNNIASNECRAAITDETMLLDPDNTWGTGNGSWEPTMDSIDLSILVSNGRNNPNLDAGLLDRFIQGIGGPDHKEVSYLIINKHSYEPFSTFKLLDLSTFTSLKAIGAASFQNRKVNGEYEITEDSITDLTIPNQCHYIGRAAFKGNVCLKNVNITCPTLDNIETTSFEDCDNIEQFSFSMSGSQSNFVSNLKNGTEGNLADNSVQSFAKYYYQKGYSVSTSEDGKTLYIRKTPLKMRNIGSISKLLSNGAVNLSSDNCSLDLSDFATNQGIPATNDYELYISVTLVEGNTLTKSNWIKYNGYSVPVTKPGVYLIDYVIISNNPAFKSSKNELKVDGNNHLTYEDENNQTIDLGIVENL